MSRVLTERLDQRRDPLADVGAIGSYHSVTTQDLAPPTCSLREEQSP
jgi:hypothetical protein